VGIADYEKNKQTFEDVENIISSMLDKKPNKSTQVGRNWEKGNIYLQLLFGGIDVRLIIE
jgi:hypothetical protein